MPCPHRAWLVSLLLQYLSPFHPNSEIWFQLHICGSSAIEELARAGGWFSHGFLRSSLCRYGIAAVFVFGKSKILRASSSESDAAERFIRAKTEAFASAFCSTAEEPEIACLYPPLAYNLAA